MVRRSSSGDGLGPVTVSRRRSGDRLGRWPTVRRSSPRNRLVPTVRRSGPCNRLSKWSTIRRGSPGDGFCSTWIAGKILRTGVWRSCVRRLTIRGSRTRSWVASRRGIASNSTRRRRTISRGAVSSVSRILRSTTSGSCIHRLSFSVYIEIVEPVIEVTCNTGGALRVGTIGRSVGWCNALIAVETTTTFPLYDDISIFSVLVKLLGKASKGFFLFPLPALIF